MKTELTTAKANLLREIRIHTENEDLAAIAQLAPKLNELRLMEAQLAELEARISKLHLNVNTTPTPPVQDTRFSFKSQHPLKKSEQTRLRITVRWSQLGQSLPDEIIEDHYANTSQAKLLGRLITQFGPRTLNQLKQFSKTQGGRMHVSEDPGSDPNFINQVNGSVYAHKPIPGTDLFLLTNTSTPEKKESIELFLNFAGLPLQAFEVQIIGK